MSRCRAPFVLLALLLLFGLGLVPSAPAGGSGAAVASADTAAGCCFQLPAGGRPPTWEAVLEQTAELRGLAPRGPIPRTLLTREQLQARVVDQLGREPVPERLAVSAKLLTTLGLLERGTDLRGLLLAFRGGLVLGQYDPESKQLFVVTAASTLGPLERVTAAHEYTHALQDQHYDLQRLRPRNAANADRNLAIAALLEADAIHVAERFAAVAMTAAEREERRRQVRDLYRDVDLDRIPLVVREQSYFPYTEGPRFLRQLLGEDAPRGNGYGAAVERLFADPPESTAQILHPERYLRREAPVAVPVGDIASSLGDDWREVRQAVLGELDHRVLVQHYLEPSVAARAAEGWRGGSYALYEQAGGDLAVIVRTRWDDAAEAREWVEAYTSVVQRRYSAGAVELDARADRRLWRTPEGALWLAAAGDETTLVLAPSPALAGRLAEPRESVSSLRPDFEPASLRRVGADSGER